MAAISSSPATKISVNSNSFSLSSSDLKGPKTSLSADSSLKWKRLRSRCSSSFSAKATAAGAEEKNLVEKSVNAIRFLAIDAVEKAKSGHPGLPMGSAPLGHILFDEVMRYNPKNPFWFNRDRFVLSAGHGCMLQYALLHLAGYESVKVMNSIGSTYFRVSILGGSSFLKSSASGRGPEIIQTVGKQNSGAPRELRNSWSGSDHGFASSS